VYTDNKTG